MFQGSTYGLLTEMFSDVLQYALFFFHIESFFYTEMQNKRVLVMNKNES